jgi:hypothetical protein
MERTKFTPFARLFSGESNMMDKISVFFGPVDTEGGFNKLYEGGFRTLHTNNRTMLSYAMLAYIFCHLIFFYTCSAYQQFCCACGNKLDI